MAGDGRRVKLSPDKSPATTVACSSPLAIVYCHMDPLPIVISQLTVTVVGGPRVLLSFVRALSLSRKPAQNWMSKKPH